MPIQDFHVGVPVLAKEAHTQQHFDDIGALRHH